MCGKGKKDDSNYSLKKDDSKQVAMWVPVIFSIQSFIRVSHVAFGVRPFLSLAFLCLWLGPLVLMLFIIFRIRCRHFSGESFDFLAWHLQFSSVLTICSKVTMTSGSGQTEQSWLLHCRILSCPGHHLTRTGDVVLVGWFVSTTSTTKHILDTN